MLSKYKYQNSVKPVTYVEQLIKSSNSIVSQGFKTWQMTGMQKKSQSFFVH